VALGRSLQALACCDAEYIEQDGFLCLHSPWYADPSLDVVPIYLRPGDADGLTIAQLGEADQDIVMDRHEARQSPNRVPNDPNAICVDCVIQMGTATAGRLVNVSSANELFDDGRATGCS
jgi:hypothetical protein